MSPKHHPTTLAMVALHPWWKCGLHIQLVVQQWHINCVLKTQKAAILGDGPAVWQTRGQLTAPLSACVQGELDMSTNYSLLNGKVILVGRCQLCSTKLEHQLRYNVWVCSSKPNPQHILSPFCSNTPLFKVSGLYNVAFVAFIQFTSSLCLSHSLSLSVL
jgi:hypothetical protein